MKRIYYGKQNDRENNPAPERSPESRETENDVLTGVEVTGDGSTLLELLQKKHSFIPAYCGGKGTCGKCKVRFLGEPTEVTDADRACLTEKELETGWRLACRAVPTGTVRVGIPGLEENIAAGTGFRAAGETNTKGGPENTEGNDPADSILPGRSSSWDSADGTGRERYLAADSADGTGRARIIAADIGTTTIAAALVDPESGTVLNTAASVNHQRSFGADVVTRMDASNRGNGPELQRLVTEDLRALEERLLSGENGKAGGPEKVAEETAEETVKAGTVPMVISANTTMQHLLQGLSCETLGVAPYTPVDISLHSWGRMTMLPGISTYVGADIVSGIIATDMDRRDQICMLIDLGTNGEMVIGSRQKLLSASTAAGPAFEGGNIHCGTAGIPGAITAAAFEDGVLCTETIGNLPPIGICGTGVLEIIYELLQEEIIDETGCMDEDYEDDGYPLGGDVIFTAKDVREVQLAKAAIRAGAEVLITEFGITPDQVDRVFLAGGFGEKINVDKAIGIGLLPEEFAGKVEAVGNSSLQGAVLFAEGKIPPERYVRVAESTQEVALTGNAAFSELYMEYMMFPEV